MLELPIIRERLDFDEKFGNYTLYYLDPLIFELKEYREARSWTTKLKEWGSRLLRSSSITISLERLFGTVIPILGETVGVDWEINFEKMLAENPENTMSSVCKEWKNSKAVGDLVSELEKEIAKKKHAFSSIELPREKSFRRESEGINPDGSPENSLIIVEGILNRSKSTHDKSDKRESNFLISDYPLDLMSATDWPLRIRMSTIAQKAITLNWHPYVKVIGILSPDKTYVDVLLILEKSTPSIREVEEARAVGKTFAETINDKSQKIDETTDKCKKKEWNDINRMDWEDSFADFLFKYRGKDLDKDVKCTIHERGAYELLLLNWIYSRYEIDLSGEVSDEVKPVAEACKKLEQSLITLKSQMKNSRITSRIPDAF